MEDKDFRWEALVFVYNADAGLFSAVSDFAHKIISPETYACNLCKLTYGNFAMKREWKDFIDGLKCAKLFLHKDEFLKKYPQHAGQSLPAVYGLRQGGLREILGAQELNGFKDLEGLKNALRQKGTV
jgi:hypothetical protein